MERVKGVKGVTARVMMVMEAEEVKGGVRNNTNPSIQAGSGTGLAVAAAVAAAAAEVGFTAVLRRSIIATVAVRGGWGMGG